MTSGVELNNRRFEMMESFQLCGELFGSSAAPDIKPGGFPLPQEEASTTAPATREGASAPTPTSLWPSR